MSARAQARGGGVDATSSLPTPTLLHRIRLPAAILASALLWIGSFPPFNGWGLAWICLVPLMMGLHGGWMRWRAVWIAGSLAWIGTIWWVGHVTVVGMLLLCLYLALFWAAWAALWQIGARWFPQTTTRNNLRLAFLGATLWVGLDWVRGWFLSGFPWNKLGVSQLPNLAIAQLSALGGVDLVTWLVIFANVIVALTLIRVGRELGHSQRVRPHFDATFTLALIACAMVWGVFRLQQPLRATYPLRCHAIQGNIPQEVKFEAMSQTDILARYTSLNQRAARSVPAPDLILWPETAPGGTPMQDYEFTRVVDAVTASAAFAFLTGALDRRPGGGDHNGAFLFNPGDPQPQVYRKERLVPFGEFIPGRRWLPWLVHIIPIPYDYLPGAGGPLFRIAVDRNTATLNAGMLICFEDVLADLARTRAAAGAHLLVNITNDGWFKGSSAAWQHAANAAFRAIETGRPLIRCANLGISGAVDPRGRVQAPAYTRAVGPQSLPDDVAFTVAIPVNPPNTPYLQGGFAFAPACGGVSAAFLLAVVILQIRRQRLRWWE